MQKTRYSKQRELILENLKERCDHPTAEDVYTSLKKENPTLSLGTVYRNLNFLAEAKMIRKLNIGEHTVHFDAAINQHSHFVCQECHTIYDIENNISHSMLDEVEEKTAHTILDTNIILSGICASCQKNENN